MKANTAISTLRGLRDRIEQFNGLAQAGRQDLIALAYAHHVTHDQTFLLIAHYLTQGIVLISQTFYDKIREGYKALEKLPSTADFKFDLENLKAETKMGKAVNMASKGAAPSTTFDDHMKAIEQDFDKFFAEKPKTEDKEKPNNEPPEVVGD